MLFLQIIRTAFRGILANKMRTSLTMLGIIIGVGSIIAMLSIGEGAKMQVMESISRIIAVMAEKGQSTFADPDDQIFIPISTSQRRLFYQEHINDINIQVEDASRIPAVKEGVERVLRERHRIAPDAESDFTIRDFTEMVKTWQETSRTFTVLLSGIAAVSLLVGGIGVMNIMLVSVTERTKEIGIRMAVGARRKDILRQFLIEALVITVSGG